MTLVYDNGDGLEFRRTISVDDKYLFTIEDSVANKSAAPVTLLPYALISRHGTPEIQGYYILHEGLIGVFGDKGEQKETYKQIEEKKSVTFKETNVWLGITDKYWAATLIPETNATVQAQFSAGTIGTLKTYQTDYFGDAQTIAPGASGATKTRLFAGAKEVAIVGINFPLSGVDGYNKRLNLNHFDLLIDWGWFYFITKPMFWAIDWLFKFLGNFGLAILAVTVIIKIIFFPLANKSYASMAKMKAVQPQMAEIRERFADDKMKQQQALMDLYKQQKINPLAGCLPILIQIPVFFALYKVLFITIEMRHAPFYGWIHDLSAQDPTNIFTLFGLIHWDPTVLPIIGSIPASRRLAADHGRDHVGADEAQSGAARSDAKDDLRLHADHLHLHAGVVLGRACDLLGLEQFPLGDPAERDHAQERRQDRAVRQHQIVLLEEERRRQG